MSTHKKIVAFDFDGVIHSYTSGWKGVDVVPDPPVEGIREVLKELSEDYEIVIHSTRAVSAYGKDAIYDYLEKHGMMEYITRVCSYKPPAICYVDDRAICFDGDAKTLVGKIKDFDQDFEHTYVGIWIR